MAERRIAIVGGGPAGLTAAYHLQRAGARVLVLEAAERVGGRTRSDSLDGCRVDTGAQLLGSMYTRTFQIARDVGLRDALVRSPGRDALLREGRVHEVVYGSVTSMLASGGLALRTKLRLGTTYVPFLTRHAGVLDLRAPERASFAGLDSESIAEWGEREMGREFVDHLVYPQLAAYYGALPEETSAGFYHALARHGMDVAVYALRGGMGTLAERLAAHVREGGGEVRTGSPVARVETAGSGATVAGEGWEEAVDGVVMAAPAPVTARLLADPFPPLAGWLAEVRFRPALTLALRLDRPTGVGFFGLSFPEEESTVVSAVCVQENKGAGLVPPGEGLLLAFAAPAAAGELMHDEARAVLDRMLPAVEGALPGVAARVRRARVYRWPDGNPVFYPGYPGRLAAFRGGGIEGGAPLVLAGDYLYSPSVEGAVTSGITAAERLLRRLDAGAAATSPPI